MGQNGSSESEALKELGKRLRKAREDKGLTAEAAAALCSGVKAATILRYERGQSEPGALKVAALAAAYRVCCNWLLGRAAIPEGLDDRQAVADLDVLDAIERAKTEDDISQLVVWVPPPIIAVVSIPKRRKIVDAQEAQGIGTYISERIRAIAPKTHRRWAAQHLNGAVS